MERECNMVRNVVAATVIAGALGAGGLGLAPTSNATPPVQPHKHHPVVVHHHVHNTVFSNNRRQVRWYNNNVHIRNGFSLINVNVVVINNH